MTSLNAGLATRALLLCALFFSAGSAHAARFLYTGGHGLDDARVAALGHTYGEFTSDDAGWAGVFAGNNGAFDAILVGEDQRPISNTTRASIASYVSNGGRVLVAGDHDGSTAFTNSVFGYAVTLAYGCEFDDGIAATLQPAATGTSFAGGPPNLGNLSCTSALNLSSVPSGAATIYAGTYVGADTALLFATDFGSGKMVWLGWDFCCGGSTMQVDDWYLTLDSALAFQGVAPTFTTCAAEGFTGSKLTLCRQICEIRQSPSRLAGLVKLYKGAYRESPPCGAVLSGM